VLETKADPALLQQFYKLEAAGWKGHDGSAIHCGGDTLAFYDGIAREAAARGYFRLYSLEVNGAMVAGAFGVTTDACSYPMKIAYNEHLRRCGPGQVMFNGIFEDCAAAGIKELFFGGDRDRYKTSWTEDTLPHFNGFVFAPGFRTGVAYHIRTGILSPLGRLRRRWRNRQSAAGGESAGSGTKPGSGKKPVQSTTQAKPPAASPAGGVKQKASETFDGVGE
jgi:hypothetical protein